MGGMKIAFSGGEKKNDSYTFTLISGGNDLVEILYLVKISIRDMKQKKLTLH